MRVVLENKIKEVKHLLMFPSMSFFSTCSNKMGYKECKLNDTMKKSIREVV